MGFGAAYKGFMWKLGAWFFGGGIALTVFLGGGGALSAVDLVILLLIYATLGLACSLPYGLRPVPRESRGFGFHVSLPGFLFVLVLFYTIAFRLFIWAGDIALTVVWKGIYAAMSRRGAEVPEQPGLPEA